MAPKQPAPPGPRMALGNVRDPKLVDHYRKLATEEVAIAKLALTNEAKNSLDVRVWAHAGVRTVSYGRWN